MPYIRLSTGKPRRNEAARVEKIMRELAERAKKNPDCIESYVMKSDDGEYARIAIYRDAASADRAANDDSVMALRSELHIAVEPGHLERAFETI